MPCKKFPLISLSLPAAPDPGSVDPAVEVRLCLFMVCVFLSAWKPWVPPSGPVTTPLSVYCVTPGSGSQVIAD